MKRICFLYVCLIGGFLVLGGCENAMSSGGDSIGSAVSGYSSGLMRTPRVTPGDASLTVEWDWRDGATSYTVYYSTSEFDESAVKAVNGLAGINYTISGLENERMYYIWVRAYRENGKYSDLSSMASGMPSSGIY